MQNSRLQRVCWSRAPTSSACPVATVPSTARFISTCVSTLPAVRSYERDIAAGSPASRYTPAVAAAASRRAAVAALPAPAAQPLAAQPAAPAATRNRATLAMLAGRLDSSQAAAWDSLVASYSRRNRRWAGLERSGPCEWLWPTPLHPQAPP